MVADRDREAADERCTRRSEAYVERRGKADLELVARDELERFRLAREVWIERIPPLFVAVAFRQERLRVAVRFVNDAGDDRGVHAIQGNSSSPIPKFWDSRRYPEPPSPLRGWGEGATMKWMRPPSRKESSRFRGETWGSGAPVLLLPGALTDVRHLEPFGRQLAQGGFRVHAMDWLASDPNRPRRGWLQRIAAEVQAKASSRLGDRYAIVGQGLGGTMGLAIAGLHPSHVTRVVSIDGDHPRAASLALTAGWPGVVRSAISALDAGLDAQLRGSGLRSAVVRGAFSRGVALHLSRASRGTISPGEERRLVARVAKPDVRRALSLVFAPGQRGLLGLDASMGPVLAPSLLLTSDARSRDRMRRLATGRVRQLAVETARGLEGAQLLHLTRPSWTLSQCRDFLLPELFVQPPIHA